MSASLHSDSVLGSLRLLIAAIACGTCLAAAATETLGQTYPTRPVRLVVPFTPGGPSDRAARLLTQHLSEALKQPVIVDNKPGAGATLGTDLVAKAVPDGYTLVMSTNASITLGPLMRRQTPYDPVKDFAHIAMLGDFPFFFMVRSDHPARTLQEFLSMAKAKPGALSYGSSGVGSLANLLGELLKSKAEVNMLHVAYKGITQPISDLLGGHLDTTYIADLTAIELVRSGKLRMLATATQKRVPAVPEVPTMSEIVPGVDGSLWYGISAPARTPPVVIDRLQSEIVAAVNSSDLQRALTGIGMTPAPLGSVEFVAFIQNELGKWGPVIKANNIKVD